MCSRAVQQCEVCISSQKLVVWKAPIIQVQTLQNLPSKRMRCQAHIVALFWHSIQQKKWCGLKLVLKARCASRIRSWSTENPTWLPAPTCSKINMKKTRIQVGFVRTSETLHTSINFRCVLKPFAELRCASCRKSLSSQFSTTFLSFK